MSDGRKHSIFEAGGKVYNLRLSFNAMCMFTDNMGPISDIQTKPLPAYRGLIWAGINAYGSQTITVAEAGDLCESFIEEKGLIKFQETMKSILENSWMSDKNAGGIDTGNSQKPSKRSSQNTSISPTGSAVSPPPNSGT
jgi:hypothetical protein